MINVKVACPHCNELMWISHNEDEKVVSIKKDNYGNRNAPCPKDASCGSCNESVIFYTTGK